MSGHTLCSHMISHSEGSAFILKIVLRKIKAETSNRFLVQAWHDGGLMKEDHTLLTSNRVVLPVDLQDE